ncbi:ChrR family anti-sigma-E factor [Jannaschia donghaensis]|uniref:Transcriptional activator ChrR n=1 Tax=Jannaschia donghaensis TaxID=420998 RepID=A0A0M6YK73_9RHOB|nr:ChrR family anti-sigma-E factor [Jannaschia donghaensis]CTQ49657.1 Transcriptional activator ChrR [Jannaschia donghaensis]
MTIRHPIPDDLLMGYAAGHLPPSHDLMVATAVSLDDDARARLAGFEAVGGALLDEAEAVSLDDGSLDAVMARLKGGTPDPVSPAGTVDDVLPAPLRDAVGGGLSDVRWKSAGLGVRQAVLGADEGGTVRLLSIPAGQAMPDHGHHGAEFTLVVQGAFIDAGRRFGRGDMEVADAQTEHQPVAAAGEDCICLVVTDAPLKFSGLLPRIAQRFLKI